MWLPGERAFQAEDTASAKAVGWTLPVAMETARKPA